MHVIVLGPETFIDQGETVISYKGENFNKSCGAFVANVDEQSSSCVKRIHHPGTIHEDWDGRTRDTADKLNKDVRPHSRACGYQHHLHGAACNSNCPTCRGREDYV